jgi:hypothetical protein
MKFRLLPKGIKSKPFFKTKQEYAEFCERWSKEVTEELDRQRIARLESAEK